MPERPADTADDAFGDARGEALASLKAMVADLDVAVVVDRVVLGDDGDIDDVITEHANDAALALFGGAGVVDAAAVIGRSITETLPAGAAIQSLSVAQQVWSTRQTARGVWHLAGDRGALALRYTRVRVEPSFLLGYFEPGDVDVEDAPGPRVDAGVAEALDASPDGFLVLREIQSLPMASLVTVDFANTSATALVPTIVTGAPLDGSSGFGRAVADLLNQARGISSAVSGEWQVRLPEGPRTITMSTKPLADGRRVLTFRDTSAKARLREEAGAAHAEAMESRAMLYAALDSLPMPVAVAELDDDGQFRMRFRNADALQRYSGAAGHLATVHEALPGLVQVGVVDLMREALRQRRTIREAVRLVTDAEEVDYDLVVSPVGERAVILAGVDVTEDRRIRSQLAEARDTALTLAEERAAFFATLTHELRTPLTTVVTAGDLLLGTDLDGRQRQLAEQQLSAARHLLQVVNDSLDLRSLSLGNAELESVAFDVDHVLDELLQVMTPLAMDAGTVLSIRRSDGLPRTLVGDRFLLERALLNLVANAVRFAPAGNVDVTVDATPLRASEWEVEVHVRDDGPGIDPAMLPRIFQPFDQGDASTRRKHGGTGLGLSLVKEIVERMNGRVWVESEPGRGSDFAFTVRLMEGVPHDQVTIGVSVTGDAARRSARVLLVEDEDVNRLLVSALLEQEGYMVDAVDNALDAVTAAMGGRYQVVLMDVRMPGIDGFEATRRIRRRVSPAELPIVALTASPTSEVRRDAADAGMQAALGKPVNLEELRRVVDQLVTGQGADVPSRP